MYDFILKHTKNRHTAWDCGTGNGQVANVLANYFQQIEATDISDNQLKNVIPTINIHYSNQRAELTNFPNNHFDLITVGQAIHWFDFDAFYQEVNRVGKEGSTLAIFGYGLLSIDGLKEAIDHFYYQIVGPYWNLERQHIDKAYASIPFPFKEVSPLPDFYIQDHWSLNQLEGYLNTWSSVQRFIKQEGYNPVTSFIATIKRDWKNEIRKVSFPILLKIGKIGGNSNKKS